MAGIPSTSGAPVTVDPARDAAGLTADEAAARLRELGPNAVAAPVRHGVLWRAGRQLRDPMILLLMGAALLTSSQGDVTDTVVIALVIVVNTTVGVVQELRAERAVAALRALAAPHARVRRGGVDVLVETAAVVPGDLLLVEAGDIVAADAEVVEAHLLETDDSALTGESMTVGKRPGDQLYSATTVTRGRGLSVVTETGAQSTLGRITEMVASARPGPTPLQRRLNRLGQQLTLAAIVISGVVMLLAILRGQSTSDAAVSAASLAVAAVPESLPAVLTLSLALGAHRMARHAAIARELRAVETLGSVTLLATDKTGTLTENRMVAERLWTPTAEYDVRGAGYDPHGHISVRHGTGAPHDLDRLLRDVVLCNDADIELDPNRVGQWRPLGDPTEAALVVLARRGGTDVERARTVLPRRGEVPFESERAWMATQHEDRGRSLIVCKGAPEVLLDRVAMSAGAEPARRWAEARAAEGFRVLVVADGESDLAGYEVPAGLALVGLVAMTDPPRQGLEPVLQTLSRAGIRVVVMTGDHPATASTIARRVGLLPAADGTHVRTGDELDGAEVIDDRWLTDTTVFARVRPEHKLALVEAWQRQGQVVAVTGDGINDGPALRTAAIGVAMGEGGTEVARQAADLILTDDQLKTVVHAVEEGRRIHDNLRRFLRYALSGGLAEVLYMLAAPLLGFRVPLLPAQILWINMLTHGLPGVAMGAEPVSPTAMDRPPVSPNAPVIDRTLARRIAVTGLLIAIVTAIAAVLSRGMGADARSSAFLVLGLAQLGVALAIREPGAARRNAFLNVAVAGAVALQVAGIMVAPLRTLLGTELLPASAWPHCLALSVLPGLVLWLVAVARRRHASPRARHRRG
jgi:Ca2+-transporting ATPase